MNIVFMGAEVPSHRLLLTNAGIKHVSLNYFRLAKRGLPKTKDYIIADRFPEDVKVYVDGGGHQINDSEMSKEEIETYAVAYQNFIEINADRISGATELDVIALGPEWLNYHRREMTELIGDKLWVVWHPETGHTALYGLAERFLNVALLGETIDDDPTLATRSRAILQQFPDVKFHGIACAKPDNLRQIPLETASSLSWLSPMMRGETIVWDGTRLLRYQKKQKDQARPRYKMIIERAGLDFDKIINDDSNEVTKLAIWSYKQLEIHLDKRYQNQKLSDNSAAKESTATAETTPSVPDKRPSEGRKNLASRDPSELRTLPVFGVTTKTVIEKDDDGRDVFKDVPVVSSTSVSLRQCDTCFVAANCPAFKPTAPCAFNLPVEVKTKDQLKALLNTIIEMQGSRVAFARYAEELNGGYPDPNTGQEIDRLFKLVNQMKELEENKEFVRMTVERQTSGGVLSALFGDRANALRELPNGGLNEAQSSKIIDDNLNL